jgi:hypothetical protein
MIVGGVEGPARLGSVGMSSRRLLDMLPPNLFGSARFSLHGAGVSASSVRSIIVGRGVVGVSDGAASQAARGVAIGLSCGRGRALLFFGLGAFTSVLGVREFGRL